MDSKAIVNLGRKRLMPRQIVVIAIDTMLSMAGVILKFGVINAIRILTYIRWLRLRL